MGVFGKHKLETCNRSKCKGHGREHLDGYYYLCKDCWVLEDNQTCHCCCTSILNRKYRLKCLAKKMQYRRKVNGAFLSIFNKIKYNPGNSGYLNSKESFNKLVLKTNETS